MTSKLSEKDIKYYNDTINDNNDKINKLKNEINILQKNNEIIKNIIINNCIHDKVIDYSAYNERTEYICNNCKCSF